MPETNHDLYIGVKSNLTPFTIDLNALTRGLVIIGQSGCGKSFLLGRILEEIYRNTTEKTRVLIIDTNNDYAEGFKLKDQSKFTKITSSYKTEKLSKEYATFEKLELELFSSLMGDSSFQDSTIWGKSNNIDLSFKYLARFITIYMDTIKGGEYSNGYFYAYNIFHISARLLVRQHRTIPPSYRVIQTYLQIKAQK